jgi:hypothetical protein
VENRYVIRKEVLLVHTYGDVSDDMFVVSYRKKWFVVCADHNYDLCIDVILPIDIDKALLDWPLNDRLNDIKTAIKEAKQNEQANKNN